MFRQVRRALAGAGLALVFGASMAWAGDPAPAVAPVPCTACQRDYYLPIAPWAKPSNTPAYWGYYVGGGCPCCRRGDPRCHDEGTWGWDYFGCCFKRRVALKWWHGRRYQGGTGSYNTAGPEPIKKLQEKLHEKHEDKVHASHE